MGTIVQAKRLIAVFSLFSLLGAHQSLAFSFTAFARSIIQPDPAPAMPNLPANFCSGTSALLFRKNKSISFSSIQTAVNAYQANDEIFVPQGNWNEMVKIQNKDQLTISSPCHAQVYGFNILNSHRIYIQGFKIVGMPSGSNGITIAGGIQSDSRVDIVNNEVTSIKAGYSAVSVSPYDSHIQITNNNIHDNQGYGVYFANGNYGGTHLIQGNTIINNGLSGITIPESMRVGIVQNTIKFNGTAAPGTVNGYGIAVLKSRSNQKFARRLSITNNKIIFNNGLVVQGSSRDISNFGTLLAQNNSGNLTTSGTEGGGITPFVDVTPPIIIVATQGNLLTNQPQFNIQATFTDESPITVAVLQNGIKVYTTNQYSLSYNATLQEGMNNFSIQAVDYYGNTSVPVAISNIKLDTIPPTLVQSQPTLNQTIYTNVLPYTLNISAMASEQVSSASVDGQPMTIATDGISLSSTQIQLSSGGTFSLSYKATDLAGNVGTLVTNGNLVFDNTPPAIVLGIANGATINQTSFSLPVTVTDIAPTSTEIDLDGSQLMTTAAVQFNELIQLPSEGPHAITVKSTDAAGNTSQQTISVIRNTHPLTLTILNPSNGATVAQGLFFLNFQSSNPLAFAQVNGYSVGLSGNQTTVQYRMDLETIGSTNIQVYISDIYGNSANQTITINVQTPTNNIWTYQECAAQ